jgi:adenylate cyclase class 2
LEIEIKLKLSDINMFRSRLNRLAAVCAVERHFENNLLFDFADQALRARGSMLRLRYTEKNSWITFKGPPQQDPRFKIREEIETAVGNAAEVARIFSQLGLRVWFQYQKYRTEFEVRYEGSTLNIALDETPIGSYAELEGSQQNIRRAAAELDFAETDYSRDSYYGLYLKYCAETGKTPGNMTFPSLNIGE